MFHVDRVIVLLNQNGKCSLLQHSVHNTTPNVCYECAHGLEQHEVIYACTCTDWHAH